MHCSFYLGLVASLEHERRLLEVAHWLEQNKFSTTVSIVDGRMMWDVEPYTETPMTEDEFRLYAAEHIIHALSHRLREP